MLQWDAMNTNPEMKKAFEDMLPYANFSLRLRKEMLEMLDFLDKVASLKFGDTADSAVSDTTS